MEEKDRLSREDLYLNAAFLFAKRGTCKRGQVGVVATRDNRIIASGYNGPLPLANRCEGHCDIENECKHAIHAEANLIAFCSKYGISLLGTNLYCTDAPCKKCSELIIQSGIIQVTFVRPYRLGDGLALLHNNNIKLIHASDFIRVII